MQNKSKGNKIIKKENKELIVVKKKQNEKK